MVFGTPWELPGSVLGAFWAPRDDQPNMGAHFVGSRDSFRGVKSRLRYLFSDFGSQIVIFQRFQACPLCRFDVVLGSSYGFPECFGEASGAQKVALEAPREAREERFHAQMAPGTSPKLKISLLDASWLQPMRPKRYKY